MHSQTTRSLNATARAFGTGAFLFFLGKGMLWLLLGGLGWLAAR
jgi:hypothetical protein